MSRPSSRDEIQPPDPFADGVSEADGLAVEPAPRGAERFDLKGRSLRAHTARGTLINGAFMIGLALLSLLRGLVLAVFLERSDYGVYGTVAVTLGTLLWLRQVGIGDKYIQQDEEDQELAFQKAFTLQVMFTALSMVVLLAALPLVVLAYGEDVLLLPGLLMILMLPAGPLHMPLAAYYRRMQFVRQRTLQAFEPVVGFIVAVALAAVGFGYWALFLGLFVGAYAGALVAVIKSPYKLRFRFDRETLRSYVGFSWPLFTASFGAMVIAQSAVSATEAHLGLAAVGAVALASQITQFTNRAGFVVTGTMYPAICVAKDNTKLLFESFVKSNRLALMWAMPFGFALSIFSADLVDFGIGQKWRPALELLQVTGFIAAIGHIGFNWDAYFRARGDTKPMAVASLAAMGTFLVLGLPLLFMYDLRGLAAAMGLQMVAHVICRAFFLQRLFHGYAFARHALRSAIPTVPAVGIVLLLRFVESGERTLAMVGFELTAFALLVVAATWALERPLLREAVAYLRTKPVAAPA